MDHVSGPGYNVVRVVPSIRCVCVFIRLLLNKMTLDLHIHRGLFNFPILGQVRTGHGYKLQSRSREKNVTKVVGATSIEGFPMV